MQEIKNDPHPRGATGKGWGEMSDKPIDETPLKNRVHFLKIEPQYFLALQQRRKNFEIRKNDRDFHEGDKVVLQEYAAGQYTGREVAAVIGYMSIFQQMPGYCVFSLLEAV
jgi:hypothetical protein